MQGSPKTRRRQTCTNATTDGPARCQSANGDIDTAAPTLHRARRHSPWKPDEPADTAARQALRPDRARHRRRPQAKHALYTPMWMTWHRPDPIDNKCMVCLARRRHRRHAGLPGRDQHRHRHQRQRRPALDHDHRRALAPRALGARLRPRGTLGTGLPGPARNLPGRPAARAARSAPRPRPSPSSTTGTRSRRTSPRSPTARTICASSACRRQETSAAAHPRHTPEAAER